MLTTLQQAKTAAREKKIVCSLPQAIETAKTKPASTVGQQSLLLKYTNTDEDTTTDVQCTARPGLLPPRQKTPRHIPNNENRSESQDSEDCDKDSSQRSRVETSGKIPNPNFKMTKLEKKFPCDYCCKRFRLKYQLFVHIRNIHKNVSKCIVCGAGFMYIGELILHKKNSHTLTDLKINHCNHCESKFKNPSDLRNHIEKVHNKNLTAYKCIAAFKANCYLHQHVKYVHSDLRNFKCGDCTKRFKKKGALVKHINNEHYNLRKYSCFICDQRFKYKCDIEHHIERCHSNGVRKYKCDICSASSKTQADLSIHKKYFHSQLRNIICADCGKAFKTKSTLRQHIRNSHSVAQYSCTICSKVCKSNAILREHKERFHNDGIRPYKCDLCEVTSKTKVDRRLHKLRHSNVRRHVCKICQKSFKTLPDLSQHIISHEKGPRLKCDQCSATLKNKFTFALHKRHVHSELIYTFICDICKTVCKSIATLRAHNKKYHRNA